jgi:hypothetical protein
MCRVPSELELEPVLELVLELVLLSEVHRSPPRPDEDEVEVLVSDDAPPSPPSALSRVITSCVFGGKRANELAKNESERERERED